MAVDALRSRVGIVPVLESVRHPDHGGTVGITQLTLVADVCRVQLVYQRWPETDDPSRRLAWRNWLVCDAHTRAPLEQRGGGGGGSTLDGLASFIFELPFSLEQHTTRLRLAGEDGLLDIEVALEPAPAVPWAGTLDLVAPLAPEERARLGDHLTPVGIHRDPLPLSIEALDAAPFESGLGLVRPVALQHWSGGDVLELAHEVDQDLRPWARWERDGRLDLGGMSGGSGGADGVWMRIAFPSGQAR